jgi:hypothetical protein
MTEHPIADVIQIWDVAYPGSLSDQGHIVNHSVNFDSIFGEKGDKVGK